MPGELIIVLAAALVLFLSRRFLAGFGHGWAAFRLWAILAFVFLTVMAVSFRAAAQSTEIISDNRVSFHFKAPEATNVQLQFESLKGTKDMERNPEGVWSFTPPSLEPDFYGYSLVVDGVRIMDPG